MKSIRINTKFDQIKEHWKPAIVAELNGQQVKVAKILGEFVMHHHKDEDELFIVMKGQLVMVFDDYSEIVNEGEMIVVPKGVNHKPIAREETWIMLFEPASTHNTGNIQNDLSLNELDRI